MEAAPGLSKNIKEANMDKLELYWSEIPMGKENAISYDKLCTAWGISQRAVRSILHKLSIYDNGDDTVLIRSSKDGGEIVKNAELNRLQIVFDEIPGEETRAELKRNGFRWSPSNQAWQRQLTPNAEAAARIILCID